MEHLIAWFEAERGRRSALARYLKVKPHAISQWDRVPGERIGEVARFTGIKQQVLRPDLFGKEAA